MHQIIKTSDGSHTIFVPALNEHYHSVHGAVTESDFIFIKAGFDFCTANPVRIFEAGFGTGLNALLTAAGNNGRRYVEYTAIEKFPLGTETLNYLNHGSFAGKEGLMLSKLIHSTPWNEFIDIGINFRLKKIEADLTSFRPEGNYDLIYFDAFGPDKQPEMWTTEVFSKISAMTATGGILVTYSSKGEVKRNLRSCGFEVNRLPGPPGKRQIIRAIKI